MERSVQLIVAGGLALVVGLWVVAAGDRIGQAQYAGIVVGLLGIASLGAGIARDLTAWPFER